MYIDFAQPFVIPPYWGKQRNESVLDKNFLCPLSIKLQTEREYWKLPIEPVVMVSGRNVVVKGSVLKQSGTIGERRGTVKELWAQDDYEVNISGIFINEKGVLPEVDIKKLRAYCEAREALEVVSPLLTIFNIEKIVIEEYQFPFTKGIENQMFTIKACSDNFEKKDLFV